MRHPWRVLVVAALLGSAALPLMLRLPSAENGRANQLVANGAPAAAEMAAAVDSGLGATSATVVLAGDRPVGRTERAGIARFARSLDSWGIDGVRRASAPQWVGGGKAALVHVELNADQQAMPVLMARLNKAAAAAEPALHVGIAGPAATQNDLLSAFSGAHAWLLIAAALVVMVLLVVTYRSPVLWAVPLLCIGVCTVLAQASLYLAARVGAAVTPQAVGLLSVVVLGALTDYAMLLMARLREELRSVSNPRQALERAISHVVNPVLASAGTVMVALGTLQLARFPLTRSFGLVGVIGIAWAAITALTVLPCLLLAARRFWPGAAEPLSPAGQIASSAFWGRVASWILPRCRTLPVMVVLALTGLGCTLFFASTAVTTAQELPPSAASVQASQLLRTVAPAQAGDQVDVLLPSASQADEVQRALDLLPAARHIESHATGNGRALIRLWLAPQVQGEDALSSVSAIRAIVNRLTARTGKVGGLVAQDVDTRAVSHRDEMVVIPVLLLVVLLALILVARTVIGAVIVLASVLLSCAAALGATNLIAVHALREPALDPTVPLLAFAFLVALSIDYNIFLLVRMREELRSASTTEGVLRALITTGPVLTSAGLVLAGTFGCLAVLPITASKEIGIAVAIGVIIDTFFVRTLVIPATAVLLGVRFWWPFRRISTDIDSLDEYGLVTHAGTQGDNVAQRSELALKVT